MGILREAILEEQPQDVDIIHLLNEGIKTLDLFSQGGKVVVDGAKSLFKANPGLVIGAAALALSAYKTYEKNKNNTVRLHAKDPYETKMITSIVDSLTDKEKFVVKQIKYEHGGKTWILERKWK